MSNNPVWQDGLVVKAIRHLYFCPEDHPSNTPISLEQMVDFCDRGEELRYLDGQLSERDGTIVCNISGEIDMDLYEVKWDLEDHLNSLVRTVKEGDTEGAANSLVDMVLHVLNEEGPIECEHSPPYWFDTEFLSSVRDQFELILEGPQEKI